MTLICHALTDAQRLGRFARPDDSIRPPMPAHDTDEPQSGLAFAVEKCQEVALLTKAINQPDAALEQSRVIQARDTVRAA